jgi:hypothetical protein
MHPVRREQEGGRKEQRQDGDDLTGQGFSESVGVAAVVSEYRNSSGCNALLVAT